MKNRLVRDWMTRSVITVNPSTLMLDAHKMRRTNKIRRLPVVKRDKVVGIVTRSDIREAEPSEATSLNVWEINYLLARVQVKEIMTKDVVTIRPDATIKDAAEQMYARKIGGLPVVNEKGHIQGIITESDIFRILIAWFNEEVGSS